MMRIAPNPRPRGGRALCACLLLGCLPGAARGGEAAPAVGVTVDGRVLVPPVPGLCAGRVAVAPAGKGDLDSLFANKPRTVLTARVEHVRAHAGGWDCSGVYAGENLSIPFSRVIERDPKSGALTVTETVSFRDLPPGLAVVEHSLRFTLRVTADEHERMFALAGRRRVEMFRMDMNDQPHRNQNISDNRAFRPYWDLGGVSQFAGGYQLWRANHADTRRYVVEEGDGAVGWADYSEPEAGVTFLVPGPREAAPWSIVIDARRGEVTVSPLPPDGLPAAPRALGRRAFTLRVLPHATGWPAPYPCELNAEQYRKLLAYLARGKGFTHLDYISTKLGIALNPKDKSATRAFYATERVQPSTLIRLIYRGDAWRMGGICRDLLKISVPRNQPLAAWEKINRRIIAKFKNP